MKNFLKNKLTTALILIATVILAGVAIFTAYRLYKLRQEAVAPTAPTSKPKAAACTEQCPGSDGVLRNCSAPDGPESDGSSKDSICNASYAGKRIEWCAGRRYCCTTSGWSTTLTSCASATPQACSSLSFAIASPTPGPKNSCGGACGSDSNCVSGLFCYQSVGYCRNPDCPTDTDCDCANPTTAPTSTPVKTPTPVTYTPTAEPTAEPASHNAALM